MLSWSTEAFAYLRAVKENEVKEDIKSFRERNEELRTKLNDLKKKLSTAHETDMPLEERRVIIERIFNIRIALEKLKNKKASINNKIERLKAIPILKLKRILLNNRPGYGYSKKYSNGHKEMESVKVVNFPMEIVLDQPFSFTFEIIRREGWPGRHDCKMSKSGYSEEYIYYRTGPKITVNALSYMTDDPDEENYILVSFMGDTLFMPLCHDAPFYKDSCNEKKTLCKQAPLEKQGSTMVTLKFEPLGLKGEYYEYKASVSSESQLLEKKGNILKIESDLTTTRGFCNQLESLDCITQFSIRLRESKGFSPPEPVEFHYRLVKEGQEFISSPPMYSHPAGFNDPLLIGTLRKLAIVPDVHGLTLENAEDKLTDAKLKMELVSGPAAPSAELSGRVKTQKPLPGSELNFNEEAVKLTVYAPYVQTATVPKVTGLKVDDAVRKLETIGFEVRFRAGRAAENKAESGKVERQNPPANSVVKIDSQVVITVIAPYVGLRRVPDVEGFAAGDAKTLIEEAGLVVTFKPGPSATAPDESGMVKSQYPMAGTYIKKDLQVELTIYAPYVKTTTVPDVKNMSYEDARRRIESAGLYIDKKDAGKPKYKSMADTAESQDPAPGTQASKGSTVLVWFYNDYVAKTIPPKKKKDADPQPGEEAIENRIIGSKWVLWELTSLNPICYRLRSGRIEFMKDGSRIFAQVTEQEGISGSLKVGDKYYELKKKVDSNTFLARRFRTGSKPPDLVFLRFPIIRNKLKLIETHLKIFKNKSDWKSALIKFNKDPWKYNSSPWNRADLRPKCLSGGVGTDNVEGPPEDPIDATGTLGQ